MTTCSNSGANGQSVMSTIYYMTTTRAQDQNVTESERESADRVVAIGTSVCADQHGKKQHGTWHTVKHGMKTVRKKNAMVS